jgi:PPOX class probable F420-dependent enzyme
MSRRDQIRMTDAELADFIGAAQTIIVVSNGKDGVPHPMPMWFGVEPGGVIVMTTFTKSQKIKNLERDPRVALLVEKGTEYSQLQGAVIYGKAELVRDPAGVVDILTTVTMRQQGKLRSFGAADDPVAQQLGRAFAATAPKRTGIRVKPEKVVSWDHGKLGAGVY